MYDVLEGDWQTPGGHTARMSYRADSSDWNTISACLVNALTGADGDEYHLPQGLSGWALDLGAHIGAVTVGLLLDNPDLRVVAIEAVPANVTLLRQNLEQNGVADRCVVLAGAAWDTGMETIRVEYGYTGSETATLHAFIGSVSPWLEDAPREYVTVHAYTLAHAMRETDGEGFVWVKSDCEGAENRFLTGPYLAKIGRIEGEWHERDGGPDLLLQHLAPTHDVTWQQGIGGGPFVAVPR